MERELVEIYRAEDEFQAKMILAALEEAGILVLKKDQGNAGIMNIYGGNSRAGALLFVKEEDASRALDTLRGLGLLSDED